ncbi:MAG TPA: MBL fold metallo-hydrolase [Erythrobacter sp.]|nr:MBL fold metallo-hydrolase [Erythrobacter sp.]
MKRAARMMLSGAALLMMAGCAAAQTAVAPTPALPRAEQPAACPATGAALQVLGSGGPLAEGDRAGTSYLLWIDGEPRLLIDAGAGSFLRFAEAGGKLASLDAILLTHLHADHAGDLAGVLNSGGFETRTQPLPIIGPDNAERFPGTSEFLTRLLGKEAGAFAYNGGFLDGSENKFRLEPRDIATAAGTAEPAGLDVSNDYSVIAHPVHHGSAPALGFAIEWQNKSVVITGDQSALSERFLADLTGSKPVILFAHHVINGGEGQPRGLHRTPAQIGELAAALAPARLVLTHNMQRSLNPLAQSLAAISEGYRGPVSIAADLDCYAL